MAFAAENIIMIPNIGQSQVLKLGVLPDYDREDYDLTSIKGMKKYMNALKSFVYGTREYKRLINYVKIYMGMHESAFSQNITSEKKHYTKIEIHHHPITMEEICKTVYDKRVFFGESVLIEDVVEEILYLHYSRVIGLIPVTETEHELIHNGYLFVQHSLLYGKYWEFIEMYRPWLPEGLEEKVKELEYMSNIYDREANLNPLRINYIYTDSKDAYRMPKYEDVLQLLSNRMNELKSANYSMDATLVGNSGNSSIPYTQNQFEIPIINQLEGDYSIQDTYVPESIQAFAYKDAMTMEPIQFATYSAQPNIAPIQAFTYM